MPKCKLCSAQSVIWLRDQNRGLCQKHFEEYFLSRVKRAISKYKMLKKSEKVVVGLSGGKDSLVTAWSLKKLGYNVEGVFIDLGFKHYSEASFKAVENFCKRFNIPFERVDMKNKFGVTVPELLSANRRKSCSLCGSVKRYVLNKIALEKNAILATGHHLSDEISQLIGNFLNLQHEYLWRQSPILPEEEGMARKIKPLCLLREEEIEKIAEILQIQPVREKCPFSKGATTFKNRKLAKEIENIFPGASYRLYTQFLEKKEEIFKPHEVELKRCKICGYKTILDICNFCRWKMKWEEKSGKLKVKSHNI